MVDFAMDQAIIGIVGAGAMGQGIAQVALTGGLKVKLFDVDEKARAKAAESIAKRLDRLVEKERLSGEQAAAAKDALAIVGALGDLSDADAVIEAVTEKLEVKRAIFVSLDDIVRPDCLLASNTSSLPIARIAAGTKHPSRIAGMHFFNPVPLMGLVELVQAGETAPETIDALAALAHRMGRTPVRVKDTPGFLVNLGGRAYVTEALHIVQEGVATPAQIDAVMRDCCGYRMGPFELMDLTGIDVNFPVTEIVHRAFSYDPRLRTTLDHRSLLDAGLLGRKTGAGFFTYQDGKPVEQPVDIAPSSAPPEKVVLLADDPELTDLAVAAGVEILSADDGESPIVTSLPRGRDATQAAFDTGVDPTRLVAVDTEFDTSKRLVVMVPPGADFDNLQSVAAWLISTGVVVTAIQDSPGFIAQRIQAMVGNLGCEIAQRGLANVADIDTAMKLGLNYPMGPLELVDDMGPGRVYDMLTRLQQITGDDRYRPSLWLRRRALLGLSARTPD
ncbi:MAG: 3-hydroxyacyl-CoA dehydrogenase [Pseudomonadota bacterium]